MPVLFICIADDFNMSLVPIMFKPNTTEVVVNITIVDDKELELTEEFSTELVIPDSVHDIGVNPGSITRAVVKIVDDDSELLYSGTCFSS